MPRDAQDDLDLLRSLKVWPRDKPRASLVVAAIDEQDDGELDISIQLGRLSAYQLVGLIQAMIEHTIGMAEAAHGQKAADEIDLLRCARAVLDGAADPLVLPFRTGGFRH
jgi:hypothetical protein